MLNLPPDVVRWISRNGEDGDCAIGAIALATGASYDVVLAESIKQRGAAVTEGMWWPQIRAVLRQLGFSTRLRKSYDLDEDTGILDCGNATHRHVTYLWAGRIVEPRGTFMSGLWKDPADYLAHHGWKAHQLLTLKKD